MLDAGASEAKVLLLLYANGDGVSFFDTRTNKGDESISWIIEKKNNQVKRTYAVLKIRPLTWPQKWTWVVFEI